MPNQPAWWPNQPVWWPQSEHQRHQATTLVQQASSAASQQAFLLSTRRRQHLRCRLSPLRISLARLLMRSLLSGNADTNDMRFMPRAWCPIKFLRHCYNFSTVTTFHDDVNMVGQSPGMVLAKDTDNKFVCLDSKKHDCVIMRCLSHNFLIKVYRFIGPMPLCF